jgi:hypothetical protein
MSRVPLYPPKLEMPEPPRFQRILGPQRMVSYDRRRPARWVGVMWPYDQAPEPGESLTLGTVTVRPLGTRLEREEMTQVRTTISGREFEYTATVWAELRLLLWESDVAALMLTGFHFQECPHGPYGR